MPDYATVQGEVACWSCDHLLATSVAIQWGKVPSSYRLGERIRWAKRNKNIVPPFVLLRDRNTWNCGDPAVQDLLALDADVFAAADDHTIECSQCRAGVGGVGVRIDRGIVSSIETYSLSVLKELLRDNYGQADIVVLEADGTWTPRPDWFDRKIRYTDS
jgi:hypothetical protein